MKKLGIILLSLLFLAAIATLLLQTPWAKEKTKQILLQAVAKEGLVIEVGEVHGVIPSSFSVTKLRLETGSYQVNIEEARLQISLWRLLKREISVAALTAKGITWTSKEEVPSVERTLQKQAHSFSFSLRIDHLVLKEIQIGENPLFDLEGNLFLGRQGKSGKIDIRVHQKEKEVHLTASLSKGEKIDLRLSTEKFPTEALSLPPGFVEGTLNATGPLSAWLGGPEEISGDLEAKISLQTGGPYLETPWLVSSRFTRTKEGGFHLFQTEAENLFFTLSGQGKLSPSLELERGEISFISTPRTFGPFGGQVQIDASGKKEGKTFLFDASWKIPSLSYYLTFKNLVGTTHGTWQNGLLNANLQSEASLHEERLHATTQIAWRQDDPISFTNYKVDSPSLNVSGDLDLFWPTLLIRGKTHLARASLETFEIDSLFGTVEAEIEWDVSAKEGTIVQTAYLRAKGHEIFYGDWFAQQAFLEANALEGPFALTAGGVRWDFLSLDQLRIRATKENGSYPFSIGALGTSDWPLSLYFGGVWSPGILSLNALEGSFLSHRIRLENETIYTYDQGQFSLEPILLQVDQAKLRLAGKESQGEGDLFLSFQNFPLDVFSFQPLGITVQGTIDGETSWKKTNKQWKGSWDFSMEGLDVASLGSSPRPKSALFKGAYSQQRVDLQARLETGRKDPLFSLQLSAPIALSPWPWTWTPLLSESTKGSVQCHGNIEEVLDFFNLGTHHLAGECSAQFEILGSLGTPQLTGKLFLTKGSYENYATGTEWTEIEASLLGDGNILRLISLEARDGKRNGNLRAKGKMELDFYEHLPFQASLDFSSFRFVQMPLLEAEGEGRLEIEGSLEKAALQGEITITKSELTIPNQIPRSLPDLAVTYRNLTRPPLEPPLTPLSSYPISFDVLLHAPKEVFIHGRGLNSEWKGDFRLEGSLGSLATLGRLSLVQGEFSFSGRNFKIEEGSLTFSGTPGELPHIDLTAQTEAKGVTVFAHLEGPLNNPQITLRSNPPLPLSSVLSYLLFGQDASEINSFQALQLVNSVASLAGESPDVLEKSRRALGIDRLQIVSVPSADAEDQETIAIQVGKYISEGVLVTFSQGAEDNGVNIGIEVDLKHGFSFVIETQQQQEQGKFSLRWSLNY